MTSITVQVPDAHAARVTEAFCARFEYDEKRQAGETKAQFVRRMLTVFMWDQVREHERQRAADEAVQAVDAEIDEVVDG
jgi:hypothetical protein